MEKAVFFDRDGVLNSAIVRNGKPFSPTSLSEFRIEYGAGKVIEKLKEMNFLTFIISNQPEIARGNLSIQNVLKMNSLLEQRFGITKSYFCPHDDFDNCECRKPKPGMLIQAALEFDLDLTKCFLVGDRWKDIEAGKAAGCKSILLDRGYDEPLPSKPYFRISALVQLFKHIGGQ